MQSTRPYILPRKPPRQPNRLMSNPKLNNILHINKSLRYLNNKPNTIEFILDNKKLHAS